MTDISRNSRMNPGMGCTDRYPAVLTTGENPEFLTGSTEAETRGGGEHE